jgi:uncharacterized protein (DUF4415 family)
VELEWDARKAGLNVRKHGVDFADAATALHDERASTTHAARAAAVRGGTMKRQYDFSRGRRGPVLGGGRGKTRITIRIDDDTLRWFRDQVHRAGGGSYQTLMNQALRRFMESSEGHLEAALRQVLREELARYRVGRRDATKTRAS